MRQLTLCKILLVHILYDTEVIFDCLARSGKTWFLFKVSYPVLLDIPFDMEVACKLSHEGVYIVLWCRMCPILVVINLQLLFWSEYVYFANTD